MTKDEGLTSEALPQTNASYRSVCDNPLPDQEIVQLSSYLNSWCLLPLLPGEVGPSGPGERLCCLSSVSCDFIFPVSVCFDHCVEHDKEFSHAGDEDDFG